VAHDLSLLHALCMLLGVLVCVGGEPRGRDVVEVRKKGWTVECRTRQSRGMLDKAIAWNVEQGNWFACELNKSYNKKSEFRKVSVKWRWMTPLARSS